MTTTTTTGVTQYGYVPVSPVGQVWAAVTVSAMSTDVAPVDETVAADENDPATDPAVIVGLVATPDELVVEVADAKVTSLPVQVTVAPATGAPPQVNEAVIGCA